MPLMAAMALHRAGERAQRPADRLRPVPEGRDDLLALDLTELTYGA